ncbi:MAG: hypothetical protein WCR67_05450, partial [Bacilli bacterium]
MNKRNKLFSLFCLLGFSLTACQNISSATTSAEASDLPSVTTSTDEPSSDVASSESAFDSEEE